MRAIQPRRVVSTLIGLALAAHAVVATAAPPEEVAARMQRAKFSGARFAVEILTGAVVGSLATYGTYESMCDGNGDCFGAGLAGFGVSFAITPLAVWGVGNWMGGDGSLGWTYAGAAVAVSPLGTPGSPDEAPADTLQRINIELAVSTILLPITSATFYELTSHLHYTRWKTAADAGNLSFGIAPTYDHRGGVDGALGRLSLRF